MTGSYLGGSPCSGVYDEDVILPDQESEQLDPAGRLDRGDPRRQEQAEAVHGDPAKLVIAVWAAETHDRGRRAARFGAFVSDHARSTFSFREWVAQLMQGS